MERMNQSKKISRELSATAELLLEWQKKTPQERVVWAYRQAAAVLDTFDANTICPYNFDAEFPCEGYPNPEEDAECSTMNGKQRWCLHSDVRQLALDKFKTLEEMKKALVLNSDIADTPLQRMLNALINQSLPLSLDALAKEELSALIAIAEWRVKLFRLPDSSKLANAFALRDLLDPFVRLTSAGFFGRQMELRCLHNHLDPEGPTEPVLLYGIGGVGKSTLLAKFILDLFQSTELPPLLAYLDIDKPSISPDEPRTLALEIIRQLVVQEPELYNAGQEAIRTIRSYARQVSSKLEARHSQSIGNLGSRALVSIMSNFLNQAVFLKNRVVLIVDTFEEAQVFGETIASDILILMKALSSSSVKAVVAGRGLLNEHIRRRVGLSLSPIPITNLDPSSAYHFFRHLMKEFGVSLPDEVINEIVSIVGRNPLSLRLASRIAGLQGSSQLLDSDKRYGLIESLRKERIHGYLFGRILNYLKDKRLESLIHPGIVLRRLTPQVILGVLAEPCHIEVRNVKEAFDLFNSMEKAAGVVQHDVGEALVFRPELRQEILEDVLRETDPATIKNIDTRAVEFYVKESSVEARAEEIYHRLRLEQDNSQLDSRWIPEAWIYLKQSITELPLNGQLWLAKKAKVTLSTNTRQKVAQQGWEDEVAREVESLLKSGQGEEAIRLLHERHERLPGSNLYLLEAQALRILGRENDACETILNGLRGATSLQQVEMLLLLSLIEESRDRLRRALDAAERAFVLTRRSPDVLLKLRALITRLRLYRKLHMEKEQDRLRARAIRSISTKVLKLLKDHPILFQEVAAELGSRSQDILRAAIDRLGLLITSESQELSLLRAVNYIKEQAPAKKVFGNMEQDEAKNILHGETGQAFGDKVAGLLQEKVDHSVLKSLAQYFRDGVEASVKQNWSDTAFEKDITA